MAQIQLQASREQVDELRERYRLTGTDDEVAQFVFDRALQDRNFHLQQNRTENNSSEQNQQ